MLRSLVAVLIIGCPWASAARAQAPPDALPDTAGAELTEEQIERAREHFQAARSAYDEGRFEDALVQFRRAYELTGNADVLYNIATVADRLRRDEVALEAYAGFLEARPDTTDRAHIEGRIRVLRQQIEREREPETEPVEPEEAQVDDSVDPSDPGPVAPAPSGPGALPWIVSTGGAILAAGGAVLLLVAEGDASAVEEPQGDMPRWEDVEHRHGRAPVLSATGGILLGVGAAAAVTGLTWALLSGGPSDDGSTVDVAVGPAAIGIRGSL